MISLPIPAPSQPKSASDFIAAIKNSSRFQREDVAFEYLIDGNVPDHMRTMCEVKYSFVDAGGTGHVARIYALPDYLAIGTSNDKLRIPLFPTTAQKLVDAWNCTMPTPKLVDTLWHAAANKLSPQPWGPPYDSSMMSTSRIVQHNARIEDQIKRLGLDGTKLTGGHKKDVVIGRQLATNKNHVFIYGWHKLDGSPIQKLNSYTHELLYADYSHGVRIVSRVCYVDDVEYDLVWILRDSLLHTMASSEGALTTVAYEYAP
jgi:hypothetical protein